MNISIFILCPLLNILYFVHEQIFFSLHLPYYIQWFFSVVRQPVKALSSSMLVQVFMLNILPLIKYNSSMNGISIANFVHRFDL